MLTNMYHTIKDNYLVFVAFFTVFLILYFIVKCNKSKKTDPVTDESKQKLYFFKANACTHCTRFKPVWDAFVDECKKNNVKTELVEVDIEGEETKSLIEKHKVRGFPHVVLVEENKEDIVFTNNRTKEDLLAFLREHTR